LIHLFFVAVETSYHGVSKRYYGVSAKVLRCLNKGITVSQQRYYVVSSEKTYDSPNYAVRRLILVDNASNWLFFNVFGDTK